jgi:hypothetical protein
MLTVCQGDSAVPFSINFASIMIRFYALLRRTLGFVRAAVFLVDALAAHFSSNCSLILARPEKRDHHLMEQQDAEQNRR